MRPEPPRNPARPAAPHGSPVEEARPTGALAEVAVRRRDDASGRRSASVSRLLGAVTRHLQEEEGELTTGDALSDSGKGGVAGAPAAREGSPAAAGRAAAGRVSTSNARPRRTSRRTGRSAGAAGRADEHTETRFDADGDDDVWSQGVASPDAASATTPRDMRVRTTPRVPRIDVVRADEGASTAGAGHVRFGTWGGLLAAVAALVVMMALGWFEKIGQPSDRGPAEGREKPVRQSGA